MCFFWFVKYLSFFVHKLRLKEIFLSLVLLQIYDGLHWGIENIDCLIIFVKDWFIDYHVRIALNLKTWLTFWHLKLPWLKITSSCKTKGLKENLPFILNFFWSLGFDFFFSCLLILPCFLGLFFVLITLLEFMVFQKVQID